jgi:hypothetical protein
MLTNNHLQLTTYNYQLTNKSCSAALSLQKINMIDRVDEAFCPIPKKRKNRLMAGFL